MYACLSHVTVGGGGGGALRAGDVDQDREKRGRADWLLVGLGRGRSVNGQREKVGE